MYPSSGPQNRRSHFNPWNYEPNLKNIALTIIIVALAAIAVTTGALMVLSLGQGVAVGAINSLNNLTMEIGASLIAIGIFPLIVGFAWLTTKSLPRVHWHHAPHPAGGNASLQCPPSPSRRTEFNQVPDSPECFKKDAKGITAQTGKEGTNQNTLVRVDNWCIPCSANYIRVPPLHAQSQGPRWGTLGNAPYIAGAAPTLDNENPNNQHRHLELCVQMAVETCAPVFIGLEPIETTSPFMKVGQQIELPNNITVSCSSDEQPFLVYKLTTNHLTPRTIYQVVAKHSPIMLQSLKEIFGAIRAFNAIIDEHFIKTNAQHPLIALDKGSNNSPAFVALYHLLDELKRSRDIKEFVSNNLWDFVMNIGITIEAQTFPRGAVAWLNEVFNDLEFIKIKVKEGYHFGYRKDLVVWDDPTKILGVDDIPGAREKIHEYLLKLCEHYLKN